MTMERSQPAFASSLGVRQSETLGSCAHRRPVHKLGLVASASLRVKMPKPSLLLSGAEATRLQDFRGLRRAGDAIL